VLSFTADIAAARPCGLVTGWGTTPDTALTAMRKQAEEQGKAIVRSLWAQYEAQPDGQTLRQLIGAGKQAGPRGKLVATFSVGSVRLAAGQVNGCSGWVAYGTLLVDGGGEGVEWLQSPEQDPEPHPGAGRRNGRRRAGR
jgi:hypothetical protein